MSLLVFYYHFQTLGLLFHHLMTTQHLRTTHQHLHSTALEMEHFFSGCSIKVNTTIQVTPFISSPDGLTVSSQLIVPTTKANNNITVICTVQDLLFNNQLSNPVKLLLQGTGYIFVYLFIVMN